MTDAFTKQIGGNHYKVMQIQPQHFCMVNGWDSGAFSVLKYLSRHRFKNGLQDIEKGRHFVELRQADIAHAMRPRGIITMQEYVRVNGIFELDHSALLHLDWWVAGMGDSQRIHLLECIDHLAAEYGSGAQAELLPLTQIHHKVDSLTKQEESHAGDPESGD